MKPAVYIRGLRCRNSGGRKQKASFGAKRIVLSVKRLTETIGSLWSEMAAKAAGLFRGTIRRNRCRNSGGRKQGASFGAKRIILSVKRLTETAGRHWNEMAEKAAGLFRETVLGICCRLNGRKLKIVGAIAAAAVIAAVACVVWMTGGESETALSAHKISACADSGSKTEAVGPTPIALYYPEPVATPETEKPKEPEDEEIYAIAPIKDNTEPAAAAEPEATYAATQKEEMTAEEMFAEEFPGEDYGKTKRTLARVIHGEAKGTKSITNRAAVAETVLNRVDAGMGGTPYRCATARHQFCVARTCTEEELGIAEDVLLRWLKIRSGEEAGWILPKDYLWYHGTYPRHDWNVFRNKFYHKDRPEYMTPLHSEIYGD